MIAAGWSLRKGDWWYRGNPSNRKFFNIEKYIDDDTKSYGIYIGRLGIVYMATR
jgi:hypothetical protein